MKWDWETVLYWVLSLFGLYIIYQALRYIFDGSWITEGLVISFLVLNFSLTIANITKLSRFEGEFREFKHAMLSMAKDFKDFREEMREFKHEMLQFKKEMERFQKETQQNFNQLLPSP